MTTVAPPPGSPTYLPYSAVVAAPALPGPPPAPPVGRERRGVRRTPLWWRDAAGVLAWSSLLVVTALWVAGGGLQDFDGLGAGLASLGRLCGLLASNLMLLQVLLMARIPLVERAYGQDELARRHRLVGVTSVSFMGVHIVLVWLGYAAQARVNPLAELWNLVTGYPGMLLATVATALLLMVAVTSMRRARIRLRYESWHLLHLYAYLGVGLALPHQLWNGQEFLTSPVATTYWWTLWGAAALAILGWRVGLPVYRTLRYDVRVGSVVPEGRGVVSVHLTGRDLDRLPVSGGQFFVWRFLTGPGWMRGHPYSLSEAPSETGLRITVKDFGDGSRAVASLAPGTRVVLEGPFGRMHAGVRTVPRVALFAGGIGITPLRALLEDLDQKPGDVTLVYRARDERDLVLREELERVCADRGARLVYVLGPRIPGRDTWLPAHAAHLSDRDALVELVPDIAEHDVYVCGAPAWMNAVRAAALAAGVPRDRVHIERFSW